ncbi:5-carboxymethyl-2-hydroxymuconate Delta-isomerase [Marinicella sp. W31]|uniref:5-carboxymethyl-2-hydroxymuconate Delta-isomerase n=1 Tax=Marinicella sp. W31 TaxID=3023713 RepID=UPI003757C169
MPHCTIEYAKSLEQQIQPSALMTLVYQATASSDLFEAENIKTRCMAFEHHMRGDQILDFIHVTLRILSGRSVEQKQALSQAVLDQLKQTQLQGVSFTVGVREMHRDIYAKYVS